MKIVRRVLTALLEIVLVVVVTALLLVPDVVAQIVQSLDNVAFIIRLLIAALLDALLLGLLYFQLRPERRLNENGLMVKASGAVTDVSIESARERILKAVSNVPDVASADARVRATNGKAHIELDVVVTNPNVSVPAKQQEISRALKQVINKQLGLQMAEQPIIHIELRDAKSIVPEVSAPSMSTSSVVTPSVIVSTPLSPMSSVPPAFPVEPMPLPTSEVITPDKADVGNGTYSPPAQRTVSWSTRIASADDESISDASVAVNDEVLSGDSDSRRSSEN
ncbi:MAG: hypothetical protein H7175_02545 [Burkholderiales bacterium]|nr:hypothetical protein [Anaerolineae bacterium]